MLILHVTIQVKPEHISDFLEIARYDAQHSEQDEPGCLRFDVLRDTDDPHKFFYYEVYKDEAARLAHRETPHFRELIEGVVVPLLISREREIFVPITADGGGDEA